MANVVAPFWQGFGNVIQRRCNNIRNWRRHSSHFWQCHFWQYVSCSPIQKQNNIHIQTHTYIHTDKQAWIEINWYRYGALHTIFRCLASVMWSISHLIERFYTCITKNILVEARAFECYPYWLIFKNLLTAGCYLLSVKILRKYCKQTF